MFRNLRRACLAAAMVVAVGAGLVVTADHAGATLGYVNEMPVSGGTLKCYQGLDTSSSPWQMQFQCNLHSAGTGAFIRNDFNMWANADYCDNLHMVWNPSGDDYVDIYNAYNISYENTHAPDGDGARGCGISSIPGQQDNTRIAHWHGCQNCGYLTYDSPNGYYAVAGGAGVGAFNTWIPYYGCGTPQTNCDLGIDYGVRVNWS